jgi:hypothetical protein
MIVTVEGQSFNTEALKGFDEQLFMESFRGKVSCDIQKAWIQVSKHIEPTQEKVKTFKKKKSKKY